MASHPDLPAEQAHIDRAYERVSSLRAAATELLQTVLRQRGATPGSLAERDVIVRTTLARLEQLDVGQESLCFGRIDRRDGEAYHIGRLAVSAEDQEPLVVDWRAPVAEPFYRATGVDTMGLVRRRHFDTQGRRLVGIEDEIFGVLDGADPDGDGTAEAGAEIGTAGAGVLLTALERARSGRMRDIVATVQKEQDEVIRADLPGVLVVQGGPGTGKTAVALHRAAYLLYTHRFPLERQGVLVVGPNPLFLRYIEQVLPSLGESGVVLTTMEGLVPDVRVVASDSRAAASLKADPRMVELVASAVADRQRPLRADVEIGLEGFLLRLTSSDTRRIVAAARRRPGTHNARRRHVDGMVARLLHEQYRQAAERRRRVGLGRVAPEEDYYADGIDGADGDGIADGGDTLGQGGMGEEELWRMLRELPVVADALHRMWPLLTAEELLHDLYGAPALIRLAARGSLSDGEQALLHRERSASIGVIPWTAGDLPLLDEARVLLGPRRPGGRRGGEIRCYGHIVVDEAQDLSPLQLRMLARRSLSGSMTVAGDIAQATGPRALSRWDEVTSFLPAARPARVVELSVNYRTPAEVMALAGRVLAVTAPHLRPPLSARSSGHEPVVVAVEPDRLAARVAAVAAEESAAVYPGTVAVIVAPSMGGVMEEALRAAGVGFGNGGRDGLDTAVTLIPMGMVKGLEFDGVVVVEPARLVAEAAQGLRALYVALTRATKRLTLVHAEPLPEPIRGPA